MMFIKAGYISSRQRPYKVEIVLCCIVCSFYAGSGRRYQLYAIHTSKACNILSKYTAFVPVDLDTNEYLETSIEYINTCKSSLLMKHIEFWIPWIKPFIEWKRSGSLAILVSSIWRPTSRYCSMTIQRHIAICFLLFFLKNNNIHKQGTHNNS